jgi:mediator of RNA polymerase II transcription subunit 6
MVRPEDLPPPEDEQFYNNPLAHPPLDLGPTLNTNNVLWYFNTSQFFDHTSNNASLIAFGSQLPPKERLDLFRSRTAFEDALRSRFPTGVQYVVVEEAKGPGMPWVIQRQNRYVDSKSGKTVVDVEGTFYSVGTTFYKAASLGDIVKARLVCCQAPFLLF